MIPKVVRKAAKLHHGDRLLVVAIGDIMVMRKLASAAWQASEIGSPRDIGAALEGESKVLDLVFSNKLAKTSTKEYEAFRRELSKRLES